MEPNRFDDVETRIVEEPSEPRAPQRPRRVGPAVLGVTAALALTGSLAAGASALTSTAQAPTRSVEKTEQGHRWGHREGLCNKERQRQSTTALSY
jgi:hypothetical protein